MADITIDSNDELIAASVDAETEQGEVFVDAYMPTREGARAGPHRGGRVRRC